MSPEQEALVNKKLYTRTAEIRWSPADDEPEAILANALYLLQLCQQDLNMGRTDTIWARAKRARESCAEIERLFAPNRLAEGRGS